MRYIQESIFDLTGPLAGFFLKPSKCVLVVSCIELSDIVKAFVRRWIEVHVLQFSNMKNCRVVASTWVGISAEMM